MRFAAILGILLSFTLFTQPTILAQEQYKRFVREVMSDIVDGKYEKALNDLNDILERFPNDLESLFAMTIVHGQKGEMNKALETAMKAVEHGLPKERFVAGPRDLMHPLYQDPAFSEWLSDADIFVHGPMLGSVTATNAKVWLRTAKEADVQVIYHPVSNIYNKMTTDIVRTDKNRDYTAEVPLTGLQPNTHYGYEIFINGEKQAGKWSFQTYPSNGAKTKFDIAFGGGAGYTPPYERMWKTINIHPMRAFLFMGDNVYIDNPTRPAVQRYCYYRRQSGEDYRYFTATRSVNAVWDDHDFTTNDAWGGPETFEPDWKVPVWELFKENWVNPSYGGGKDQPGCWFSFSMGDVDFFLLDSRYYKMNPKEPNARMLGDAQMKWLKESVKNSDATFKVIASPVPWSYGAKPGSLDPWQGHKEERKEIFSFFEENKIDGIFLISADRHRSDAWKIKRENGYDLYEFQSSRLTNIHTHGIMDGSLFGYNEKCSFGLLKFDTTKDDPTVSYEIHSIDNELIHKMTLKHSQMKHKK